MPDTSTLFVFALASLALIVVPGPNLIYIATRSVSQGRRHGVASALGVELGTLVHIGAATVGLSALIASSAVAFDVVRYAGAAYLIFLGIRTIRDTRADPFAQDAVPAPLRRTFAEGVIVNVLNPKVALFFLAFLPQFVDPADAAAPQIVILGLTLLAIGVAIDFLWVFGAAAMRGWLQRRPTFVARQRFVTGGIYVALGAGAALTGGRHTD
jgi:threonine/homoserine/homoserine lactone efflux protein